MKGVLPCSDHASIEIQGKEVESSKPEASTNAANATSVASVHEKLCAEVETLEPVKGDGESVRGDQNKIFGGQMFAVEPDVHQLKLQARATLTTALSSGHLRDAFQCMRMVSGPDDGSTNEKAVETENALRAMPSDCLRDAIEFVKDGSADVGCAETERARQRARDAIVIAVEKDDFERVLCSALGKSGDPVQESIKEVPPVQGMTREEDVVNEFLKEVPRSVDADNELGSKEEQLRTASPPFSDITIAALKLKVQEALLCGCESGALTAALETVSSRPPSRKFHSGEECQSRPPSRKSGGGRLRCESPLTFQNEQTIPSVAQGIPVEDKLISDMSKKFEILQNDNAELKCQLTQMTQMMVELRDACQLHQREKPN